MAWSSLSKLITSFGFEWVRFRNGLGWGGRGWVLSVGRMYDIFNHLSMSMSLWIFAPAINLAISFSSSAMIAIFHVLYLLCTISENRWGRERTARTYIIILLSVKLSILVPGFFKTLETFTCFYWTDAAQHSRLRITNKLQHMSIDMHPITTTISTNHFKNIQADFLSIESKCVNSRQSTFLISNAKHVITCSRF